MPRTKPIATVDGLPADFRERVDLAAIMANYA
jgi:hypothetical protein